MKNVWIHGPRLVLSLLVLWAGWAALTIFLGGWRSLVEEPNPAVDVTASEPASGLTPEALVGGSWRFAGMPWSVRLEGHESTQPPDPAELVMNANAGSAGAGVPLQTRHRDALRALTFLGASERRISDGRRLWTLDRDRMRVALLLEESGEKAVLLGGTVSRHDAGRQIWTTHSLVPLASENSSPELLIPESAHPQRIASRCDSQGRTLLEIALVPPGEFTERRIAGDPESASDRDNAGLQTLERRTEAGRTVTYLRGPDRNGEPILVVATASDFRGPASQPPTGN